MITRVEALEYIKNNPGATNKELAAHFKTSPASMATRNKQWIDGGFLTRKEVARTASKIAIYGYYLNVNVAPEMNKSERKATLPAVVTRVSQEEAVAVPSKRTVGQRQENGEIGGMILSLGNALAKQIAAQVMLSLQSSLHKELSAVIPTFDDVEIPKLDMAALLPAPAKKEVTKKQMKVAVVGLLAPQAGLISTEFGQHFDLTFWNNDGQNRLKSLGIGCDLVLVTKWCSHATTETLKNIGAKWRKVTGGMDELRSVLTELFVQEN